MYIILVYDIGENRVGKALKICRRFLTWIQNSVFEGELSESKLKELKLKLKALIKEKEDSVLIFRFKDKRYFKKEAMGLEKNTDDTFL
ncbi:MAG: CRISPR-associated endonuclease Cas2 [bacterium]